MDSISDNVVAIIAVVVGILIIGTALVPIVQHASGGEETTITGINAGSNDSEYFLLITPDTRYALYSVDETVTINGTNVQEFEIEYRFGSTIASYVDLNGTITLTGYTMVGADSTTTTLDQFLFPIISSTNSRNVPNSVIGMTSEGSFIAGTGAFISWETLDSAGFFKDGEIMDEEGQPLESVEGLTITDNDNGTWTLSAEGGHFIGPETWTGHTAGGTSQYATLYGVIPIMCILAMAYVLIRRF